MRIFTYALVVLGLLVTIVSMIMTGHTVWAVIFFIVFLLYANPPS
jgi:hypothetical protein